MLAVLFISACVLYWLWQYLTTRADEPPLYPGALPVIGHALSLVGGSNKLWSHMNDVANGSYQIGGVVKMKYLIHTVYVITDPDDMITIANTCLEKDNYYNFAKPWIGDGLITSKVSIWKQHRKLLNPAFSQTVLDSFLGVFNSQSRKLVHDMEKEVGKGPFNHWTYTRLNALQTICLTAFGVDFSDTMQTNKYMEAIDLMFKIIIERFRKLWLHNHYIFKLSNLKKERNACLKILQNISDTILQKRKTEFTDNVCEERSIIPGTRFKAFMDLLLELSLEKSVFSDREIRQHIDTMVAAGHDTSANVLMFTILSLGAHPEVQEKIVAEIKEVLGEEDRDIEKQDLSQLVYLDAVIKESLRIHTIVPLVARRLDREVKLKNCSLLAGRTCIFLLSGLHRHPVWGPDRHQFRPDRWLDPSQLPDNPYVFAAFGVGRRACIGRTYAIMSMKTTLAHLLRHYRIMADDSQLQVKMDTMLKPESGYYVSMERRTV